MKKLNRLYIKEEWINGEFRKLLKYKDNCVDIGALSPELISYIIECSDNAVSNAYELGLKEGAYIAREVYKNGK